MSTTFSLSVVYAIFPSQAVHTSVKNFQSVVVDSCYFQKTAALRNLAFTHFHLFLTLTFHVLCSCVFRCRLLDFLTAVTVCDTCTKSAEFGLSPVSLDFVDEDYSWSSGCGSSSVPGRRVARQRDIDRADSARRLVSRPLAVTRRR